MKSFKGWCDKVNKKKILIFFKTQSKILWRDEMLRLSDSEK